MNFEVKWSMSFEFPWLEKIHDYVWTPEEEEDNV